MDLDLNVLINLLGDFIGRVGFPVFVVGYLLAALVPVLGSVVYRAAGTWDAELVLVAAVAAVQGVLGVVAHRAPLVDVAGPD